MTGPSPGSRLHVSDVRAGFFEFFRFQPEFFCIFQNFAPENPGKIPRPCSIRPPPCLPFLPFCNPECIFHPVCTLIPESGRLNRSVCQNTSKLRPLKCPQTAINGPPAASFFGIHQLPVLPEIGPKKREYVNLLFRPIAKILPIWAWF